MPAECWMPDAGCFTITISFQFSVFSFLLSRGAAIDQLKTEN
jgi:hypothetical protein